MKKIGAFTLKPESGDSISSGSIFEKKKMEPTPLTGTRQMCIIHSCTSCIALTWSFVGRFIEWSITFITGAAAVRAASKLAEESRGTPSKSTESKPVQKKPTPSEKPSTVSWWAVIMFPPKHLGQIGFTLLLLSIIIKVFHWFYGVLL